MGRPSIDPELMIRMLIVGYCFGIRSERRLCEEVAPAIWRTVGFAASVSTARCPIIRRSRRIGMVAFATATILRQVFETSPASAASMMGWSSGEGFAVDASLIKAEANRQKGIEGEKGLPPETTGGAVAEYLAVLDDAAFGAATEVTPKFVSPADPAARWTGVHGGQGDCQYFCVRPVIRHEFTNRSLNMTAN